MTPDVISQRNQFLTAFQPRAGERVLDVGSGPGYLLAAIAESVGPTGYACGIDVSEPLNAAARSHCAHQPWAEIRYGEATHLPFPEGSFDGAVSTQVLEYVSSVDDALFELYRVIRPGGRVAILDTDWDSIVWHSPSRDRMDRVLKIWEEHVPHPNLPRTLAKRLHHVGFRMEAQQILPLFNPNFDGNTYSNRMIDLIVLFVTNRNGINHDEAQMWAKELRESGFRHEYFFSLNRYLFLASKP